MVVFPNAKINIGLHIINKRKDGYHNLESIFYPVGLCDILEVVTAKEFSFTQTGLAVSGSISQNIVVKAYDLLKNRFNIGPAAIHLHKIIPTGAGLGGGSSDAAFTLKALNALFELNIGQHELADLALELGSDCPFFIHNKPMLVKGRGEHLQKIEMRLQHLWIKIVHTGLHVSTKTAFEGISLKEPTKSINTSNYSDKKTLLNRFKNDFEDTIFKIYPNLSDLKKDLQNEGAFYTAMTGSGSAIYGIFESEPRKTGIAAFEYIGQLEY